MLLIGASGTFGRRLARFLAAEPGVQLLLGGRTRSGLEAVAKSIASGGVTVVDRDAIDARQLEALGVDAVIDASGPFQAMDLRVPRAAIAARVHYVDLADSRGFVASVPSLDAAARAAGVAVVSGASSTPALSHAAIDALCAGWQRIDTLRVVISPSNRQPRGRSVIDAILGGVGQPLTLLREGRETIGHGWGGTRRVFLPGIRGRWASWCDTPDMDLLRSRYRPRVAAEFLASLELPIMHLSLAAIGRAVRMGRIKSALPLAGLLQWLAGRLEQVGSDWGGMIAEAKGVDADGKPAMARWWLRAKGGAGPNVPVLAALAVVRRLRDGTLGGSGAGPCVGLLSLDDFNGEIAKLGIETGIERVAPPMPLFRAALGAAFDGLPEETRAIHSPSPVLLLQGLADVEGGANAAGRAIARLFGFPSAARAVPLSVVIEQEEDGSEGWSRVYPGQAMRSRLTAPDAAGASVEEHFGWLRFTLALKAVPDGIDIRIAGARLGQLPLPRFAWPRIIASERAERTRHRFDVEVGLPMVGRLVRYTGWLGVGAKG